MILRMQATRWNDSTLARDGLSINPVFNHRLISGGEQSLCDDLATYVANQTGATAQVTVKAYNVEAPQPNPPRATKTLNTGSAPSSSTCRELAIALSFFADPYGPRTRGRLYIPLQWLADKSVGVRPTQAQRDLVKEWANGFSALGGADIDWGVWSDRDKQFRKATHVWVDDEWDIIRSRGLRPTGAKVVTNVSG